MGYTIHFEPDQTEQQKIAILHLAGFTVLDDTGAVVCLRCNAPAEWKSTTGAGESGEISCSNSECAQPPE